MLGIFFIYLLHIFLTDLSLIQIIERIHTADKIQIQAFSVCTCDIGNFYYTTTKYYYSKAEIRLVFTFIKVIPPVSRNDGIFQF